MFQLVQTATIVLTIATGFLILLYSLLDRTRITVWSLWCAVLCSFIQVCYAAVTVFAARNNKLQPEPVSLKCNDIYTIPTICDVLTMTILVTSAIGVHFRSSKASILKHIFVLYIMICSVVVIAIQSLRKYYKPLTIVLTRNLEMQSTSCYRDLDGDIVIIAFEYLLIYFPLAAAVVVVYSKSRKSKGKLFAIIL